MARPREFDEEAVLDAAIALFWSHGYEASSMRDLAQATQLTNASLYNAFGDKRALFERAIEHYAACRLTERIQRYAQMPPLEAIEGYLREAVERSLADPQRKGCLIVNSALELAPHDAGFEVLIGGILARIESFFLTCVQSGQQDGSVSRAHAATELAHLLLGTLMGIRVLARVRPERPVLEDILRTTLSTLQPCSAEGRPT